MKLAHHFINKPINLSNEELVNFLVIENQNFFLEAAIDLNSQLNKQEGIFVLSCENQPVEIYNKLEVITDFINLDINKRLLVNKLLRKANEVANEENLMLKTVELKAHISRFAFDIAEEINHDIDFLSDFDVSCILKAINFKFRDDEMDIPERLINYMLLVRELECDKCFVLINFRDYISDGEIDNFYKTVLYNKLKVLVISAHEHPKSKYEKRVVIDKDLCEF